MNTTKLFNIHIILSMCYWEYWETDLEAMSENNLKTRKELEQVW
jgi:hypothetical protein